MIAFGTDYPICHRYLCFCYHFAINEMLSLSEKQFIDIRYYNHLLPENQVVLENCPTTKVPSHKKNKILRLQLTAPFHNKDRISLSRSLV